MVDRRRHEFRGLDRGIHLKSHTMGPLPLEAEASLKRFLEVWEENATDNAWMREWWNLSAEVGDALAPLLGADPGTIQTQANASCAFSVALSCFDFGRGERTKVVVSELDFPTERYVLERHLGDDGELVIVPSKDGISVDHPRLLETVDSRTALVVLSHSSFGTSSRVNLEAVVSRAHEVGAMVLADVYQSAGVLRIDAQKTGIDFLVGGTVKWLCGGPGTGFLYVRPDLIPTLSPRLTGWIGHRDPFAFSFGGMEDHPGIRRFAQGTPNVPGFYTCLPGIRLLASIGAETLEEESRRRTSLIVSHARERGWRLNCPLDVEERGPTVVIGVEEPEALVEALDEKGVFVDWRPRVGIRVSPHFFNTDEEVHRALDIMDSVIPVSRSVAREH